MGRMNDGTIDALYEYGKKAFLGEIDLDRASTQVSTSHPEVAKSSARHYISWYSKMREGSFLTWNTNSGLLLRYAERIIAEENTDAGAKAIKSARLFARHSNRMDLDIKLKKLAEDNGITLLALDPVAEPELSDNDEAQIEPEEMSMSVKDKLTAIKAYIAAQGFSYPESLIENYYLCLKSKPFVILAGTSGTGKTRLVKLFAEAIGAAYFLVSVRPDWSDGSDLFGHYDLNGKFIEGPVCKAFNAAFAHPEKPVFLCLDEMNLARVEYYLSDFLSVIESREIQGNAIITDGIAQYDGKTEIDGVTMKKGIPDNLYFVGTVNMDETTFPFSKKVLDRANTIEFNYVELMPSFGVVADIQPLFLKNDFLRTEYLVLARDCAEHAEFVNDICTELQRINEILVKANAHVGYRVRDEIVFYMLNNKKTENLLTHEQALDNAIMQKILPRIQGSSAAIREMLCDLFKLCATDYNQKTGDSDFGKMTKTLDDSSLSCKFKNSAEKIAMMTHRFETDGFTSYWL